PRFFCPQAFRECAIGEDTVLQPMERIGPKSKVARVVQLTGPLSILTRCDDPANQIPGCPWATLTSLRRFYHNDFRWLTFFRITYKVFRKLRVDYNFYDHPAPVSCQICQVPINSSKKLVEHLCSQIHKEKVVEQGTSVHRSSFLYWSNSINSSFDGSRCRCEVSEKMGELEGSAVVETEEPQEEVEPTNAQPLSRKEIVEISREMQSLLFSQRFETRLIFRPRLFCPQAFRTVANEELSALHAMNRVCTADSTTINRGRVPLVGPRAILARCDDPSKQRK
ncbi:hypothetical protein PENTCL1PPCAC_8042, partial [Pristionchus entomophagus]